MQWKDDILKELESIGSKLGSISRQMPYAVPDNYFEALTEQLLADVWNKDVVAALPKEHPFETPQGYFEELPSQVLAAIKQAEKPKTKTIAFGGNTWKHARIAAAAALLLLAGAGIFKAAMQENSFDNKLASLPDDAVREYVLQTSNELNTDNTVVTAAKNVVPEQLTEEEITQYLDETGWQ